MSNGQKGKPAKMASKFSSEAISDFGLNGCIRTWGKPCALIRCKLISSDDFQPFEIIGGGSFFSEHGDFNSLQITRWAKYGARGYREKWNGGSPCRCRETL